MFAVSVELLAGRYAATAYNDRDSVEWPPHPARLFSALVAIWGEDEPRGPVGEEERAALEWLEQQEAPEIFADPIEHAGARSVAPVFVPVNDEYEVGDVDRSKLDDAEAMLAATQVGKPRAKAEKDIEKLRVKLSTDTAKAIAAPTKYGKERRAGLRVLPEHRGKQPRTFPVAHPATPRFAFVWPSAQPSSIIVAALAGMLARLVRLGHSSSQVHAAIADDATLAPILRAGRFRPDVEAGELVIRWVSPGQVTRLIRAYDLHREIEPRVLPAQFVRYTRRGAAEPSSIERSGFSSDFVVFERTRGARLPITSAPGLSRQFRRALMSFADEPIHPAISGHRDDGAPSELAHLAVVPLPFVGREFADGCLLGIALVLPRTADAAARHAMSRAIGAFEARYRDATSDDAPELKLELGEQPLFLRRVVWGSDRAALNPRRWGGPSRRWATATPIALDRNPGDLHDVDPARRDGAFRKATEAVAEAVERIGLPSPAEIDVVRSCVLSGTAKPRMHPRFPSDPKRTQRVLVHARIVFHRPVSGPILLGAGRFQGLGLCAPVDDGEKAPR
jgi:CRISPR-associated protein Csb2